MTKKKTFDSVQFMRDARARLSHEIEVMTPDEEIAFFRNKIKCEDILRVRKGNKRKTPKNQ
jgi:hypothetical protein